MTLSLLATKFYIPHLRPDLVARPRLLQKLSAGLAYPLTLVSAPAGFGKTTLLSAWNQSLMGNGWSLAWLSLEAEDNDPARFLGYLAGALEPWAAGILAKTRTALASSPPQDVLPGLLESIERCPAPLIVILEDYHIITTQAVHEIVVFLIQHRPPQLHIILSTRSDPPLPLARWRLQEALAEIRADDLRFSRDEIVAYLEQSAGETLSGEAVDTLEARTEGWIAGLKLAVLSLRNTPYSEVTDFIRNLSGNHRLIADYLLEEVIESQPETVRRFLLQTSILPSLAGALCDVVTGEHNGQDMLEYLERANLFIVQLDDERIWYRYHHLFADLLRQKLEQRYPGQSVGLRRRAANWYLQNDYTECAIDEVLGLRDYRLAADWIVRLGLPLLQSGQRQTVTRWVEAIPPGILADYPRLDQLRQATQINPLTQREVEVLRQIAAGASNQEIAANLVISLGTVKKHLNNIFTKLGTHNRTQALARAREVGLL
jgi:LuxR family maltose regulon positive regulatory protein